MHKMRWQFKALLGVGAAIILAISASAFTDIFTFHGQLNLTDYSGFYHISDYTGPATVEVQAVSLKPGEAFPWHYHMGLAYAILARGTMTADEGCGRTQLFHAGAGFVENPGLVHRVINSGHQDVLIYWATMYPSPSYQDVMLADPPSCGP